MRFSISSLVSRGSCELAPAVGLSKSTGGCTDSNSLFLASGTGVVAGPTGVGAGGLIAAGAAGGGVLAADGGAGAPAGSGAAGGGAAGAATPAAGTGWLWVDIPPR